jgi:hypothetical protein
LVLLQAGRGLEFSEVGMPAKSDPRLKGGAVIDSQGAGPETRRGVKLYRRRALTPRDVVSAIGAGIAVGLAAAYLAQIMLRRTPLGTAHPPARSRNRGG